MDPRRSVLRLRDLLSQQRSAHRARDYDAFFVADEAFHGEIFAQLIREHTVITDALEHADTQLGRQFVAAHARRVLTYAPELQATFPHYFEQRVAAGSSGGCGQHGRPCVSGCPQVHP